MNIEEEQSITCPYCGKTVYVMIDRSYRNQEYIEDCQVCCRPIIFQVTDGEGNSIQVNVRHENE